MTEDRFKEVIYGPYRDSWKVVKILQEATDDSPKLQEVLSNYMSEIDKFSEKYEGNEFAGLLRKMMLSADDTVMRMGRA